MKRDWDYTVNKIPAMFKSQNSTASCSERVGDCESARSASNSLRLVVLFLRAVRATAPVLYRCLWLHLPALSIMNANRNFIASVIWFFLLPGITQAQQPTAQVEKLFASGVQALKDGRLEEAEKTFQQVLRQGGKAAFVHHNLGIIYQQKNEQEKAVAQFREATRLQPDFGEARLLIGHSLLALGKNAEAVRELEQAVRLLPKQPQARIQLAKAYERTNNWFGVVDQFRSLRELEPANAEYAYQLGKAYNQLSEWSYQQIIRVNSGAARLYQTLGQNYLLQGRYEWATLEYQRAINADPKLPELHLALALIFLEQKKLAEAQTEIDLELKLVPESKTALAVKQKILTAKGQ